MRKTRLGRTWSCVKRPHITLYGKPEDFRKVVDVRQGFVFFFSGGYHPWSLFCETRLVYNSVLYINDQQTFSVKSHIVNSLGFIGHLVSVTNTKLCHFRVKADTDKTNEMCMAEFQ